MQQGHRILVDGREFWAESNCANFDLDVQGSTPLHLTCIVKPLQTSNTNSDLVDQPFRVHLQSVQCARDDELTQMGTKTPITIVPSAWTCS